MTLDELRAIGEAIKELRASAKVLVFYSRVGALQLIGDRDEIRAAFERKLPEGVEGPGEIGRVLQELRLIMRIVLETRDDERAVDVLLEYVFADELEGGGTERKEAFSSVLTEKVRYVSEALVDESLRSRCGRLRSTVGPAVEEVDVEVVSGREDRLVGESVGTPFLRLRFRYTEAGMQSFPFFSRGAPWGRRCWMFRHSRWSVTKLT
jgi:hypothetical protein